MRLTRAGAFVILLLMGIPGLAIPVLEASPSSTSAIPTARPTPPQFAALDEAVLVFMEARGIHAASFALTYKGTLVWSQGYGTLSRGGVDLVQPDTPFRIASVTKPLTAAAVKLLVAEGKLHPSDRVFCADSVTAPPAAVRCHLQLHPGAYVPPADARTLTITVQQLLDHRGGWDRTKSGDLMFKAIEIAAAQGVPSPPGPLDIARYAYARPLDFPPGNRVAYSNYGYMLLGLIVEKASGMDYTEFVRTRVLSDPLEGIAPGHEVPRELALGRTLAVNRDPREPVYNCDGGWKGRNVFNPAEYVCWADGGWHLEVMEAHGGLIASAPTLVWFLDHYRMNGDVRPPYVLPVNVNQNAWFFGSLDGTFTLVRQRPDGYSYAVLLNQRWDPSGLRYDVIKDELDAAVGAYHQARRS